MLAIASFAVGAVASVVTPTVQPSAERDTAGDQGGKSVTTAPDLALGASDADAGSSADGNGPRHA